MEEPKEEKEKKEKKEFTLDATEMGFGVVSFALPVPEFSNSSSFETQKKENNVYIPIALDDFETTTNEEEDSDQDFFEKGNGKKDEKNLLSRQKKDYLKKKRELEVFLEDLHNQKGEDYDSFFGHAYEYYYGKGFYALLLEKALQIVKLAFMMALCMFLIAWVDWGELMRCGKVDFDYTCGQRALQKGVLFSAKTVLVGAVFFGYWAFSLVKTLLDFSWMKKQKYFYETILKIYSDDIGHDKMSWEAVMDVMCEKNNNHTPFYLLVKKKEQEEKTTENVEIPEIVEIVEGEKREMEEEKKKSHHLDPQTIISHIMRKENYILSLFSKTNIMDVSFQPSSISFSSPNNTNGHKEEPQKEKEQNLNKNKNKIFLNGSQLFDRLNVAKGLSFTLDFIINFCITRSMFEKDSSKLKKNNRISFRKLFLGGSKKKSFSASCSLPVISQRSEHDDDNSFSKNRNAISTSSVSLARKFKVAALLHVVLSPFILVYLFVVRFFFGQVSNFYYRPAEMAARDWSRVTRYKFREVNELRHSFEKRMALARKPADEYMARFPSASFSIVGKFVCAVLGALVSTMLFVGILDDSLLTQTHIFGKNLVWFISIFAACIALARSFRVDDTVMLVEKTPEQMLEQIAVHTHYLPRSWRASFFSSLFSDKEKDSGKEEGEKEARNRKMKKFSAEKVQKEFSRFYKLKILVFFEELASIVVTPYLLWFVYARKAGHIVEFINRHTVDTFCGPVCSYGSFDFDGHHNSFDGHHYKNAENKSDFLENESMFPWLEEEEEKKEEKDLENNDLDILSTPMHLFGSPDHV